MTQELSVQQSRVRDTLPATAEEIASELHISVSTVYDHVSALKRKGVPIARSDGQYIELAPDQSDGFAFPAERRPDSSARSSITRQATQSLGELKNELLAELEGYSPPVADGGLTYNYGNEDMVIFRTDDHFGEVVEDEQGNEVFNSQVAEQRVSEVFNRALEVKQVRENIGATFDTAHVVLGGDIVTNEAIYASQPHDIDAKVTEQVRQAAQVYVRNLKKVATNFDSVQVVCQHGNHGEFRVDGASGQANADDLLYAMIDMVVREAQVDGRLTNVTLRYADGTDYMNFTMRDGQHRVHLRHGDNCSNHIGTSSPQSDWLSWEAMHEFDLALRGHYHEYREEPLPSGTQVIEGGSIKTPGEYEESLGVGGRPASVVFGVTDEAPATWREPIYFDT